MYAKVEMIAKSLIISFLWLTLKCRM